MSAKGGTRTTTLGSRTGILSVSNPGSTQNTIRAVKIPSSTQERRISQMNRRPGTGFSNGERTGWSGAGGERGEDDALLLEPVGPEEASPGLGRPLRAVWG